jgi:hypothetical membrane protein
VVPIQPRFGDPPIQETRDTGTRNSQAIVGGLLYLVSSSQYIAAQLYVAAAWDPAYNWFNNYISDLGNTTCGMFALPRAQPAFVCSPRHAVMNAAFAVSGALLIAGTVILWRILSARSSIATALWLLVISGLGKILIGCVSENENILLHSIAALNIPIASVAILLISKTAFQQQKALALVGFGAFAIGMLATTLSIAAPFCGTALLLGLGVGGMERLAGYPANVWLVVVGLTAMAEGLRTRRR